MEDEAQAILRADLSAEAIRGRSLIEASRARVESLGGVEMEFPEREMISSSRTFRQICRELDAALARK